MFTRRDGEHVALQMLQGGDSCLLFLISQFCWQGLVGIAAPRGPLTLLSQCAGVGIYWGCTFALTFLCGGPTAVPPGRPGGGFSLAHISLLLTSLLLYPRFGHSAGRSQNPRRMESEEDYKAIESKPLLHEESRRTAALPTSQGH